VGFCEHGNEALNFTECDECLNHKDLVPFISQHMFTFVLSSYLNGVLVCSIITYGRERAPITCVRVCVRVIITHMNTLTYIYMYVNTSAINEYSRQGTHTRSSSNSVGIHLIILLLTNSCMYSPQENAKRTKT
jgi:hypothetical protein